VGGLTQPNTGAPTLRAPLAGDGLIVAPGAFDALSARLVERAGFETVYGILAMPDISELESRFGAA
jgi:2-methylisocitrate lyase-like PEP mutase family enzyme